MSWVAGERRGAGRLTDAVVWACLLVVCGTVGGAAQLSIESLPLAAAYGDGVHAFFAGDYDRAYEDLTQAIEAGTNDPRAYYFRGLAALRQGRSDEAEADFSTGADRESKELGAWPVSRSLERIQGADRLRLERYRMRARVALLQRQREAERLRYSQMEEAQPDVLRDRRPVAPKEVDERNVFEDAKDSTGGDSTAATAPEETSAEPMPAPAEEAPAERPGDDAGDDPFGDESTDASRTEQAGELAAEREDFVEESDEQAEMEAAETEDAASQADQQAEQEAAAGDQ